MVRLGRAPAPFRGLVSVPGFPSTRWKREGYYIMTCIVEGAKVHEHGYSLLDLVPVGSYSYLTVRDRCGGSFGFCQFGEVRPERSLLFPRLTYTLRRHASPALDPQIERSLVLFRLLFSRGRNYPGITKSHGTLVPAETPKLPCFVVPRRRAVGVSRVLGRVIHVREGNATGTHRGVTRTFYFCASRKCYD